MKINWGTSIAIAFALFMSFILYFVLKVQIDSKYDNDLVVEEYYKHDVHFQDEMVRIQNAHDLKIKPVVSIVSNGINIIFPDDFVPQNIKGSVALYRPSNKKFDFKVPISLKNATLFIPKTNLIGGRWDVDMEWQYKGKQYLTKEVIYIQ